MASSSTAGFLQPSTPQSKDWTSKRSGEYAAESALASSPLFREDESYEPPTQHDRSIRGSSATSSMRISRDLEQLRSKLPSKMNEHTSTENDHPSTQNDVFTTPQRASGVESDTEEPASYSELSKKADSILAAAKKRLSLLEGNIKGARDSLSYDTVNEFQTSERSHGKSTSISHGSPLNRSPSMRINFGQPRTAAAQERILKAHSRNFSETSVPSPRGSITKGSMPPQFQTPRDLGSVPRLARQANIKDSRRESILEPVVEEAGSPTRGSDRGSDNDAAEEDKLAARRLTDRTSQLLGLRSETENVRERLSTIQQGVFHAVDSRRSWQDPRPRVLPEEIAAIREVKSLERTMDRQEAVIGRLERNDMPDSSRRTSRDVEWDGMTGQSFYNYRDEDLGDNESGFDEGQTDYTSVLEELDQLEPDLDAAHEDRVDAFDYENFIIHSVFNNATLRPPEGSSRSSTSSASTAREIVYSDDDQGDDLEEDAEAGTGLRAGNQSMESFETAQTFIYSSGSSSEAENDEDEDDGEIFNGYGNPGSFPMPPSRHSHGHKASRSGTAAGASTFGGVGPTGRGAGHLRMQSGARPSSTIFSALVDPNTFPRLNESDQTLVRSLAEALRFACVQLQRNNEDPERAMDWRSKLESALHILSGSDEMM